MSARADRAVERAEFAHIRRAYDTKLEAHVVKILPGEFYATGEPEYITTTLGSCVSACLWDPIANFGGMNHFMLPDSDDARISSAAVNGEAARYGSYAMEHLINTILKAGGRRERLRAKIVGGGRVLAIATDIGARNIAFVRDYLTTEAIRVVGEDVGGNYGRQVRFFPHTGAAAVKPLASTEHRGVVDREGSYRNSIKQTQSVGDAELF